MDAGRKPRIGLVLGSGGARGLAQIGVIEVLEERGLEIVAIAGTSIGALVGGLHAAGQLGAYRDWLLGMDRNAMLRLLDPGWGRASLFTGKRLVAALREVCGSPRIEELPIDFTAVAVDLEHHRELWLRQGDLWDALRASFAIPGVFTPHVVNGRALVDGGLLAPLPLTAMRMADADVVVAVDLNGSPREQDQQASTETDASADTGSRWWPLRRGRRDTDGGEGGRSTRLGFIELMTASLDTMQARLARVQLALDPPGVEVRIPRDASQFYEFWRAAELIALGREEAAKALDAAGY